MSKQFSRKPSRPRQFADGAAYLTVKLHRAQLRCINCIAGAAAGGRAAAARMVIDAGLKALRAA